MTASERVADHYGGEGLVERLLADLAAAGHDIDPLDPDVLAGADEFHMGGRTLTDTVLHGLGDPGGALLDVGCGIGGPARVMARRFEVPVVGLDLTPEFVDAAEELTRRTGLADSVSFELGSALDMPFPDDRFAGAVMFHVGMNIEDKHALFAEVARVLGQGATFVVYDIMRLGDGEFGFPVPWATDPSTSFVATPDEYADALRSAGFEPDQPVVRTQEAMAAMADQRQMPVFLSHLMGDRIAGMIANLGPAAAQGVLAPTQITAHL
ncbi:MAG: methyltransferase domain-containing protein [Actinomycetota bacterium]